MPDLLDAQRRDINKRLDELRPLVDEYAQFEQAAAALDGVGPTTTASARRGPGRPRAKNGRRKGAKAATTTVADGATIAAPKTKARKARAKRAGRPKGGGKRATETLEIVAAQPGITIPEIAAKMKIEQNYLYRVLPGLEKEKKLRKEGKGWHAT